MIRFSRAFPLERTCQQTTNIRLQTNRVPPAGSRDRQQLALNEIQLVSAYPISVSVILAERTLYLRGLSSTEKECTPPAILRGTLVVRISRAEKIKRIWLEFLGRARTEWPNGIPHQNLGFRDDHTIIDHVWSVFDASSSRPDAVSDGDFTQLTKDGSPLPSLDESSSEVDSDRGRQPLQLHRFSFLESHGIGRPAKRPKSKPATPGYRLFDPGEYAYDFELVLGGQFPESINLEWGKVEYSLNVNVERDTLLWSRLSGKLAINVVQSPEEDSIGLQETIYLNGSWKEHLRIQAAIQGKYIELGSRIFVSLKLSPLARARSRCLSVQVVLTENVEYWTHDRKVRRQVERNKISVFAKRSAPSDNSSATRDLPDTVLVDFNDTTKVDPVELEATLQVPACAENNKRLDMLHPDTMFEDIVVRHWIKIILLMSKPEDFVPREYRMSLQSPIRLVSCKASASNVTLPAYDASAATSDSGPGCCCPGSFCRGDTSSATRPELCDVQMSVHAKDQPGFSDEVEWHPRDKYMVEMVE
ncbi:hypothetical protein NKR23_g12434 [Pleurostoma richardsiae]|uniref:Arrestin C-terminal-like domain-containing protein n=1 Tax=Pleurostoma richardsiae TaxID=41990 RepID=A0AA38R231_9PEZI|nr:hypothetical protein NKR23_g12434 [Pleurostoma richardsiae]